MSEQINMKELRKSVMKYMADNRIIGKRLAIIPVKEVITINKKGMKHLLSRNYGKDENKIVRIGLVKNIVKILSDAVYINFQPNDKSNTFSKASIIFMLLQCISKEYMKFG